MARIPDDIIDRIKTEMSLVRLVESQGYVLTKLGKDLVLCCPFHEEKTPSCKISAEKNVFHCLGCGAGGSVIDWYMKINRASFRRATEELQRELGATPLPLAAYVAPSLPLSTDADDQKLLRGVVDFYRKHLPY